MWMARARSKEMIYFVQSTGGGPVKIGWSRDQISLKRRLQLLQNGYPEKLVIIRTLDGPRTVEKWLHRFYAVIRLEGEWFRYRDDMLTILPPLDLPSYRLKLSGRESRPPKTTLMKYIIENGLFQNRFAQRIGVTQETMSRYVSGKQIPSSAVQLRIQEFTKGKVRMGYDWRNGKSSGESR